MRIRALAKRYLPGSIAGPLRRWEWRVQHRIRFLREPNYPRTEARSYLREYFPDLLLDESSIVIDLGANEGWFSLTCAEFGATVIAFEPNPYAFRHAFDRLESYERAFVINSAVSNCTGLGTLYFPREYPLAPELHSGSASIVTDNSNVTPSVALPCLLISLGSILDSVERIDFLKVDIEGAESLLWPTIAMNSGKIRHLAMETHEWLTGEQSWVAKAESFIKREGLTSRWRLDWP